jgi:iron complex transport system substrate-binding protein
LPACRWLVALVSVAIIQTSFSPLLAKEGEGGGRVGGAAETHAQRIISLAPSVTETLFALGAGDEVVGVSTYCDYPPEVRKIKRVGTFLTPNVEAIIALRPDVIIGVPTPGNERPVRSLQSLGLKVVIVGGDTMRQMRESIDLIAQAISRAAAGRDLLERIDARLAAIQARVHAAPARRVLMVVGQKPLVAVGSGTFQDELIRMAGGINVAGGTGLAWPHLNIETVIAWAPEVIIDTSMGTEESARTLEFWKQFPSLPAVRDQRVYGYRSYQLLRPGPRIAEALDAMARAIHPERFSTPVQSPTSNVQGPRTTVRRYANSLCLGIYCEFRHGDFGTWTLDLGLPAPDLGPWTLDLGPCLI